MIAAEIIQKWSQSDGIQADIKETQIFLTEKGVLKSGFLDDAFDYIASLMVVAEQHEQGGYKKGALLHIAKMAYKIYMKEKQCDQQKHS